MNDALDHFIKLAYRRISDAGYAINKFASKLNDDPVYAMEWSDHMWAMVWQKKIWKDIVIVLSTSENRGKTLCELSGAYSNEIMLMAKYPCRSTSIGSRQSAIAKAEVLAIVIEEMSYAVEAC